MSSQAKKSRHSDDQKIKNSMMEEDSPKKEDGTVILRRSLRHSPGNSSLSPPRKSRRLKEPCTIPEKPIKEVTPSKSKVPKVSPRSQCTPEKAGSRRSTRSSPLDVNESVARNTRNSPNISISPTKLTKSKNTPEKRVNSPVSTSKKNAKKNLNCSPNKAVENNDSTPECRTNPRSKRKSAGTSQSTSQAESLPTRSTRKRNLTLSPNSARQETTNGTSSPRYAKSGAKRKCQNVSSITTPNGKAINFNKKEEKPDSSETRLCANAEESVPICSKPSLNLSPKHKPSSEDSSISSKSLSSKRKLISEDVVEDSLTIMPKKCKVNESEHSNASSTLDRSSNSLIQSENSASLSLKSAPVQDTPPSDADMDVTTNAEKYLGEFGLSDLQKREVISLLPEEFRDESCICIIKELVSRLLQDSLNLSSMSSPRFNKLLRQLIMKYCSLEDSTEKKHQLSETVLSWAKDRKVVNLQHELELALMTLYYDTGFYRKAEETATALYKETKKLQDKEKTVKACLCLSKAYHAMGNVAKARANITTAKTEALKIYTPPDLQAELDLQSGIMQVAEEKDMETAFSYFKEAATAFTRRKQRSRALKYMLLAKLLVNKPDEGYKAVNSQLHMEDIDEGVEALLHITKDAISCSLSSFMKTQVKYKKELEEDLVIKEVIDDLYTKMLEKNLLNIISPYEKMQISFIAEKIGLSRVEVERRLSQMILDGQLSAQLDHRDDCLYVYQHELRDSVYPNALKTISQLDRTLSLLNRRIKQLL